MKGDRNSKDALLKTNVQIDQLDNKQDRCAKWRVHYESKRREDWVIVSEKVKSPSIILNPLQPQFTVLPFYRFLTCASSTFC